jgi:hypothetical protein
MVSHKLGAAQPRGLHYYRGLNVWGISSPMLGCSDAGIDVIVCSGLICGNLRLCVVKNSLLRISPD